MINYNEIYLLNDSLSNRPFRGEINDFDLAEPEISRGEKGISKIVPVKHSMGGKTLYDFVWTTNAFPIIVSEHVIELFRPKSVTGWQTYDVEIYSKKNELIEMKYFGLVITGRCGNRDYSANSIVMDKIGIKTKPHSKGFYFKDNFWDGSDLFMCNPDENGKTNMFRFCTKKVVDLFKKENIKNVLFEKVIDFSMAISLYDIPLTEKQKAEMEKIKASR